MDQSLFAAPHGFSQRITSFIACACLGIHQMPLRHLIVLIANAHPYWIWNTCPPRLKLEGVPNLTIRATLRLPNQSVPKLDYLLQSSISDAIDVFGMVHVISAHAERAPGHTLRPASRDQIRGCAVRQHPPERQSDEGEPSNNHRSFSSSEVSLGSDQSSLHNVGRTGIRHKPMQTLFSSKDKRCRQRQHQSNWWS